MDTSATAGGSRQEDEPERLAHYSTGRLTCRQAQTVNAWRDLLVPTQDPPGDRPRASRSDAIAAAVTDLLRAPPAPLEVARYAYAGMAAQLAAAQQKADPGTAPLYPPRSAGTCPPTRHSRPSSSARPRSTPQSRSTRR